MTAPIRLFCQVGFLAALGLGLAACANKPASEMPAATAAAPASAAATPAAKPDIKPDTKPAAPAAQQSDAPPMDRTEANAQCWMKYDKTAVSLEAKAKLVEKCADEKLKGR
jgi:hypothetical protein